MADAARKQIETRATLIDFEPTTSLYRGRATVLSDDPTVGRVQVDGTFFFPLPGVRATYSLEAVPRGKRQPTFRSLHIEYSDEFDPRFALDTLHTIALWGGLRPEDPSLSEQFFALADQLGASIPDAIVEGTLPVEPQLLDQLGSGLYRLRQALSLVDFLGKEFRFDEPACVEVVNALSLRGKPEDDLIQRLRENPYLLAGLKDVHLTWKTLETMAARFGIDRDAPQRIDGKIVHSFSDLERNGHTAVEHSVLLSTLERDLLISPARIRHHVNEALSDGRLTGVDFDNGMRAITTPVFFSEEEEIVRHLTRLARSKPITELTGALERRVDDLGCPPDQKAAILGALTNPLAIIDGGPGSGKSYVLGNVAQIAFELGCMDQVALGPTGRAALRIQNVLPQGVRSRTIHRALLADGIGFRRDANNPIDGSVTMIDESGMLSNPLALGLFRALPTAPLLLFGDPDQLPPVERGEPFRAFIDSKKIPIFTLSGGRRFNENAREAIIATAEACLQQNSDEFLQRLQDPEIIPYVTLVMPTEPNDEGVLEAIVRGLRAGVRNGKSLDSFQIISRIGHTKSNTLSTKSLHEAVTDAFIASNPNAASIRLANGTVLREGERIMQSKNNYDINLMNGDIGIIESIQGRRINVRTSDTGALIPLSPFQCQSLIGGFAGTPHRLQGGGVHTAIIPLSFDKNSLMGYRALFTAMTRATDRIILVGTPHVAEQAVLYEDYPTRVTTLESTIRREMPAIRPPVMQQDLLAI